jgi:hypothetical protein
LKTGGRAAIIFNATIMNDQHRDILKWFLENCNLYKIIVNPSGSFKCTGIETYSFIFTKGTPTQKIEYYEFETNKKLGELTLAQIEERGWDIRPIFQIKKLNVGNIVYKKLSEICSVEKGTIQATKAENGQYNCYSGAEDVATHNEAQFEGPAIIYVNGSSGSKGRIHYAKPNEKFAATSLVQVLKTKDISELNIQYLMYYFQINKSSILKLFESSNMRGTIQVDDLKALQIPLPPLPIQQEIVEALDKNTNNIKRLGNLSSSLENINPLVLNGYLKNPLQGTHVLAILNEMEAELATLEQMAAKAEQRAKFILDGYLTTQAIEAEPLAENVMVTPSQTEEKPVKKRVFKVVAS